jgi:O-antigen/teichoic acid export membrane protein
LFPVTTLSFAIYPTISRLWAEDRASYAALLRLALRAIAVIGVFAATGTALFADIPVNLIYGAERFGPAAAILRVLAIYVVLVYASILLGIAIAAAKRQLRYAVAQSLCVVVSVILDPILIPRFERLAGNGGLGVSASVVAAEVAMVAAGLALRAFPLAALPLSIAAYACILRALGGLDAQTVDLLRDVFRRKGRRPPAAPQAGATG